MIFGKFCWVFTFWSKNKLLFVAPKIKINFFGGKQNFSRDFEGTSRDLKGTLRDSEGLKRDLKDF
jgi:hypothetical protein